MHILEAQQLTKIYGHHLSLKKALTNVSLSVEQGEFLGIMGPSGAGKSTLLNLLSTIDTPTSGRVMMDGRDITHLKGHALAEFRRRQLGFIFQDFNLLDALKVRENIVLPLAVNRLPVDQLQGALTHVASVLGLSELLDYYPSELSVGQRQRVASARTLIVKPQLLFADEPTGSLDSQSATEFLQYLQTINGQEKMTIIMVTHDAFTASFCKRILFIKDGQIFSEIIRQGDRQEFFDRIIDMQATIGGGGKTNALRSGD
ncbi:ABC transporter ATP-binding protein [Agrilactobacillus yilanensis]|uniref:ABC transporter ATP-binding protein n=1 Tax=Agrilactobacillus yilanensis TaxID=2485997 RepID=A0ABW4JA31_9LACO|nr:ABC transporter ATP-binding protein [Agrilactobacillus yilanensis]